MLSTTPRPCACITAEFSSTLGFEVDECFNGVEAIEKALQTRYDLLVVDVNMPVMDGYRFLKKLRRRRDVHQAGDHGVDRIGARDRHAAYVAGANIYLTKPRHTGALFARRRSLTGEVQ
ncbi:response regulator [Methylosinus trichosporium]|uniref:response regulator n=1 Tax=Methylosinus trichosporium TaxID=426 RepID=UPI0026CAD1B4